MAKQRMIDPKLWSDQWIRKLNPLDRYLFIYLLTNERSSWCGVYELDLGVMAFESGIDERDLEKSMLPRLAPKVLYVDGWVCFKNWDKYHNNGSEQTKKGIENAWEAVPEKIRLKIKKLYKFGIPPIDPIQGTPSLTSSSSSSFTSTSILQPKTVAVSVPKKREIQNPDTPIQSWADYLNQMDESNNRSINIIAHFFRSKGLYFETTGKASSAIKRHLRAARDLAPFSDEEIMEATKQAKKEYAELYTIETLTKILTR